MVLASSSSFSYFFGYAAPVAGAVVCVNIFWHDNGRRGCARLAGDEKFTGLTTKPLKNVHHRFRIVCFAFYLVVFFELSRVSSFFFFSCFTSFRHLFGCWFFGSGKEKRVVYPFTLASTFASSSGKPYIASCGFPSLYIIFGNAQCVFNFYVFNFSPIFFFRNNVMHENLPYTFTRV